MAKSKPAFQGQNEAPAPAQGPNQGVYDAPKHGVSRTTPSKDPVNDGDYSHDALLESPTRSGLQPRGKKK